MVRFMTRTRPAPRARRLTAQSSATLPAPTSSTVASSSPSSASRATTAATEPTDAGLVPIAVSVRMRRPVSIALSKRRESTGPTAFSARLSASDSRTCPSTSASPGTSESSPPATR